MLDTLQSTGDFRERARQRLPWMIYDFIDGGAGEERASARNAEALDAIQLMPRVLRDVSNVSCDTEFLGRTWGLPFGIAPMGMCALAWPKADEYFAHAARAANIPHCLSTAASTSLETAISQAPEQGWFQLYVAAPDAAWTLVQRALDAGYQYLVLTVDTPVVSRRRRELRRGFKVPFKIGPRQFVDFALHPQWSLTTLLHGAPKFGNNAEQSPGAKPAFDRSQSRGAVDFDFLAELRARWPHKLIVKGVLDADAARQIAAAGIDAIYVSNHGGRQLDAAPAAIDCLRVVRQAVGPNFPLIFDSGLRSGEDILKAFALGADFVMFGRPFLYAVAAAGQSGVQHLVHLTAEELRNALAQIGCTSLGAVDETCVVGPEYSALPD